MTDHPRVVAVVCHYWPNRRAAVDRITSDLYAGSVIPHRVIVLNNSVESLPPIPGASTIHAGFNTTCRGKFVAALFNVADYYLLLDDDTSVGTETLAALLQHARPDTCTGYLGCWVNEPGSTTAQRHLWPADATEETPCQTFCGCALFLSFSSIVRMLMLEAQVRLNPEGTWRHEGDDILVGLANRATVVPLHGAAAFVPLGDGGQAMSTSDPNYYGMRDAFTRDVLRSLQDKPLPEWP